MFGFPHGHRARHGPFSEVRPAPHRDRHGDRRGHDRGMQDIERRFRDLNIGDQRLQRDVGRRRFGVSEMVRRNERDRAPRAPARVSGYTIKKSLSTGGMSDAIHVVKQNRSSKIFIAKHVAAHGSRRDRVVAELDTLKRIKRGQNLNYLEEYFWSENQTKMTFILQHCDAGTLEDMIDRTRKRGNTISELFIARALLGVANALAYLHFGIDTTGSKQFPQWDPICHLDIKPPNVFLISGGRGQHPRVVLGDFGCAVLMSDVYKRRVGPLAGTPGWEPDELTAGSRNYVSTAADVWQLAGLIQTLCRLSWRPDKPRLTSVMSVGSSYSGNLNGIVRDMAARHHRDRPDAREVAKTTRQLWFGKI